MVIFTNIFAKYKFGRLNFWEANLIFSKKINICSPSGEPTMVLRYGQWRASCDIMQSTIGCCIMGPRCFNTNINLLKCWGSLTLSFCSIQLSTQVLSLTSKKCCHVGFHVILGDLRLGTMCEVVSPNFHTFNGWDCSNCPQVTMDLGLGTPCESALLISQTIQR